MKKKMMMTSAVLGAVALGAGAFVLSSLGGGAETGPVSPRVAHAAADTTGWHDPFVFVSEDVLDSTGVKPTAYQPGATLFPETPATGETPGGGGPVAEDPKGDDVPVTPPTGGADEPAPADSGDGPDAPIDVPAPSDPAGKPPVIVNPKVTDAICEALHCNEPELPLQPGGHGWHLPGPRLR